MVENGSFAADTKQERQRHPIRHSFLRAWPPHRAARTSADVHARSADVHPSAPRTPPPPPPPPTPRTAEAEHAPPRSPTREHHAPPRSPTREHHAPPRLRREGPRTI